MGHAIRVPIAASARQSRSIMFHYEKAWQDVRSRIARAARACGREPEAVRLVAVSKTFPAEAVRAVHALGQREFGENYVQEGVAKMAGLADLTDIAWHLVGPLQSNKAPAAAAAFAWVQTVDREKIAVRLSAARPAGTPALDVCIQVNASGEDSKSGVAPAEAVASRRRPLRRCPGFVCAGSWASPSPRPTSTCAARSSACCASASTRASMPGLPGRHAVDGNVGRPRRRDCRRRDAGARWYSDLRRTRSA